MSHDLDKLKQDASEAVATLRQLKEKYGAESVEFKSAIERTDASLKNFDQKNEALVRQIAEAKNAAEDQTKRIGELEVAIARGSKGDSKAYKSSAEYKELSSYLREGKSMTVGNSTEGGYLAPVEMANDVLRQIIEVSPVRSIARVITVGKRTIEMPKRTSIPTASYEGELEQSALSQSAYGNETLTAHRLAVTIPFTRDLLMDSGFDLESLINEDVALAFAKAEGLNFVSGNGVKKPEGFLSNAELLASYVDTAAVGSISADDLLLLTGQLKQGYDPYFAFNRQTLATLRTLKGTTNDHYLWQMGLAPDAPNTIGGDPYIVLQDMPSVALGAFPIVYGDFRRGYQIIDRTGMMVIRDELTGARQALINLTFNRWNHGQVVMAEAFKLLRVKPS